MAFLTNLRRISTTCMIRSRVRSFNHLTVTSNTETKVAVLSMGRKPVNSMNLELLTEISIALEKLETERRVNGLILTSSLPNIFSAGLDITEMVDPDPDRLALFWRTLQDVWVKLYGTGLVTIAAINGNNPAGGCLLSLMCDYRILADGNYKIGLNETQLGHAPAVGYMLALCGDYRIMANTPITIGVTATRLGLVPPFWIQETMINTIGQREAEKALTLGKLFTAQEALELHLVDQLVPQDKVVDAATHEIKRWLQIPDAARCIQKQQLRQSVIHSLLSKREQDIQDFCDFTMLENTQTVMKTYLDNLRKKAKN